MTEREAKKELMRRANEIDATVRIGKDGFDEGLADEIILQLKKRRLIKIKVLNNADTDAKETADKVAEATSSVVVDVRGGVIVLTDSRTWDSLCQKKY